MTIRKLSGFFGGLLLAFGLLTGCHEPNQPAPTGEQKPAEQKAAAIGAPAEGGPQVLSAYQPESNVSELKTCNLEGVNGTSFQGQKVPVSSAKSARFLGWIAAPELASPRYVLRFEDKAASRYFQATFVPAVNRPDVAASLGDKVAHAGFTLDLDLKPIPPADYHVYLAALDGTALQACDNGRSVIVGP
jgi:hypothetical protein